MMVRQYTSSGEDRIIDIRCNNGQLLGLCKHRGARVLSLEPADMITKMPAKKGRRICR